MNLLSFQFPDLPGFQSCQLVHQLDFERHARLFVQLKNLSPSDGGSHCLTVSTINCLDNTIKVYDSAYTMRKDQEDIPIEKVKSEKDLGVIIDNKLTFTKHINSKIKIANRNLGIIFRTFTYIDKDIFLNSFKSLVHPHLEYASTVWCPVFKKDRVAIENVQTRATKLVSSISHLPYSERLRALGLPSLEYRWERADVIQVYKILHDTDKVDKNKLFTLSEFTSTRGHSLKLFKLRSKIASEYDQEIPQSQTADNPMAPRGRAAQPS